MRKRIPLKESLCSKMLSEPTMRADAILLRIGQSWLRGSIPMQTCLSITLSIGRQSLKK
jgi:hypothetical protein